MKTKYRQKLATIMKNAWRLARCGAKKFGGKSVDYFRMALVIIWYNKKYPSVQQAGGGIHFLLPGLNTSHASPQGQLLLPGMSL